MTHAYTDTQQIDEGWEIPTDLNDALEAVDAALEAGWPYLLPYDAVSGGEHEWATELAVQGILEGKTPHQIAELIVSDYDPTPDYMPIGEMF
jgi:hypothetical protein